MDVSCMAGVHQQPEPEQTTWLKKRNEKKRKKEKTTLTR